MKRSIIYVSVIIAIAGLTFLGIKGYRMYQKYGLGMVYLDGNNDSIPVAVTAIPPLTYGNSDWPCWRGPGYDGKSNFSGILKDWSSGLDLIWKVSYLCRGEESVSWSGPVIQGNRLVITGRDENHDLVFCLQSETGELIWKKGYAAEPDAKFGTGPRATPLIHDDRVYTFGRGGDLACWDLLDGTLFWKKNVLDEGGDVPNWGFSSSPVVLHDKVIVQGGGEARLVAFNKITGDVIWKSPGGEAGYATVMPVLLAGTTYLLQFHGTGLALVDTLKGEVMWDLPWETEYGVNAATPIVKEDTVFITSGYKMGGQALKISTSGTELIWKSNVISSQLSDPVLIEGYLYGYAANADNRGPFKAVKLATGEERWSTKSIGGGSVILIDGQLVCFDVKGNLHLVRPNPYSFEKTGELLNAIPGVKQESWTPPAFANGKLYLRYMHQLVCYDLVP